MIPSLPNLPRSWEMEGLKRKAEVARFHAGMETGLRSGETRECKQIFGDGGEGGEVWGMGRKAEEKDELDQWN